MFQVAINALSSSFLYVFVIHDNLNCATVLLYEVLK